MDKLRRQAILIGAVIAGSGLAVLLLHVLTDADPAVLLVIAGLLALIGGSFTALAAEGFARPAVRAATGMASLAEGGTDTRITSGGELAEAFNRMAQSIERLLATASLERNRLLAALNSSSDAIIAVDADTRLAFANAAAERLFGRGQDELMGRPFAWVMPHDELISAIRATHREGQPHTLLVERSHRTFQASCAPIVGGSDWASLIVIYDITDVRRLEQVRRDFVANVSHELRTPLASIKSVIETLEDGALDDRKAATEFLARADQEVDRLTGIVEELLELSRLESGDVPLPQEPVNIASVMRQAADRLESQAEKKGVAISLDIAGDLPEIRGDADRLERAVINLLHNAIKFTPAGGSVALSAASADGSVEITVADTGAGIDPEDLPRVFERFYKADRSRAQGGAGGTGLGLAVVKHTVEAHGGTVTVDSRLGEGARFTISLPAAASPQ